MNGGVLLLFTVMAVMFWLAERRERRRTVAHGANDREERRP